RARDFLDPGFFIERSLPEPKRTVLSAHYQGFSEQGSLNKVRTEARRFFTTVIDDTAVDLRLRRVPLFARYLDTFISRLVPHDLLLLPPHIQFMDLVRINMAERPPQQVQASPTPLEQIGVLPGLATAQALGLADASFAERRTWADETLYAVFSELLEEDVKHYDSLLLHNLYGQSSPFGASGDDNPLVIGTPDEGTRTEDFEHFYNTAKDNLMEVQLAQGKDLGSLAETEDDGAPGLMLPRSGEPTDDLAVQDATATEYLAQVARWRPVISGVADVLLTLASPKELISVPRYRPCASVEGVRLHPARLPQALVQLETCSQQAIWQPVRPIIRHQELQFSGLDIFLLLDVSGSMGGPNAHYAAATALCLIEGLQTARYRATRDQSLSDVDVRAQLLAFGSGWAELTALVKEIPLVQKEAAYYNLMHPQSNFTLINGALKQVRASALANPARDVFCLIISDGLFSDNYAAFKTMQNMPGQVYAGHISIGEHYGIPITPRFEMIASPTVLPQKLHALLEEYRVTSR
ncbi:MAG: VWA domain-containing protein, partial [Coriobacteriales bacterium]|nr:VWA domain-containing protein [Coriobacteriales bacterium]